jgi:hypothetical protein
MNLLLVLTLLAVGSTILAAALVIIEDPRVGAGVLAGEYALVAGLLTMAGQPGAALSRIGVGACVSAIIVITLRRITSGGRPTTQEPAPPGRWFRAAAALLVVVAAWGLADAVGTVLPTVTQAQAEAGLSLLGLGLLQLGLTEAPLRWIFALLTTQLGFEVIYAVLEPSLAVQAILAGVHLGIVLVGSDIAVRRLSPEPQEASH